MQASFFRYILNWTLYRISRKIKRNESQIFIIGKLFLIRHPCHVLPFHVPYMSRPSLSCSLHVTSFLVLFLTCHVPSLSCSLHVTYLPCRVPYMSRSFLVVFLTCHVLPCRVPYMSRPSLSCSLHVTFLPCRVPYMSRSFLPTCFCQVPSLSAFLQTFFPFLFVLVTSSCLQSRSFFSQLSSSLASCSALLVILLPV